jgi:FkbM family methyltransferase
MIKSTIAGTVQKLAPTYYRRRLWRRHFSAMRGFYHEQELHIVPSLCDKNKTSIDIGAAEGIYTIHIIDASRDCVAFEPRQSKARELAEMVEYLSVPVRVEAVALSDVHGRATLRMLERDEGRSTIERDNTLEDPDGSGKCEITVPTQKLDEYKLDAVGFIKIDVEGHECAVLRGALQTIRRCLPVILIEIEERHKPNAVRDVHKFFLDLEYEGYFLLDRSLMPIGCFDLARHQNVAHIGGWKTNWRRSGVYVNNFFFVPAGASSRLEAAVYNVRSKLSDQFGTEPR